MSHSILYIDPGSGSYLVQVLVAAALGVSFFFRNIVNYIRSLFRFPSKKKSGKPEQEEQAK